MRILAGSMNSGKGSQELTRVTAAYVTSIAFALAFLCAVAAGADGMTALWRGVIAALCGLVGAHLLAPPVIDVVLTSMARDEVQRRGDASAEEEA